MTSIQTHSTLYPLVCPLHPLLHFAACEYEQYFDIASVQCFDTDCESELEEEIFPMVPEGAESPGHTLSAAEVSGNNSAQTRPKRPRLLLHRSQVIQGNVTRRNLVRQQR